MSEYVCALFWGARAKGHLRPSRGPSLRLASASAGVQAKVSVGCRAGVVVAPARRAQRILGTDTTSAPLSLRRASVASVFLFSRPFVRVVSFLWPLITYSKRYLPSVPVTTCPASYLPPIGPSCTDSANHLLELHGTLCWSQRRPPLITRRHFDATADNLLLCTAQSSFTHQRIMTVASAFEIALCREGGRLDDQIHEAASTASRQGSTSPRRAFHVSRSSSALAPID